MLIIINHYYKIIINSEKEIIFKAIKQVENGWVIEIIRANSLNMVGVSNSFLTTYSNGETLKQDRIVEMSDSDVLAIRL